MRRRVLLGAGLLLAAPVSAQTATPVPEMEKAKHGEVDPAEPAEGQRRPDAPLDTAAVTPRAVPDGLGRFRSDPAYDYERVGAAGPSLWDLFWRWVEETFLRPLAEHTSSTFWRWFWPILAALVLAAVLVRLFRAGGSGLFARRAPAAPEGALLLDADDLATVDLDALLRQALVEHRHRDAVRFLYLRALQALAGSGLVEWQKDKTNRDYLREVRRRADPLARPFAEVTRLFEWVWYGEAAVDEARFEAVRARFDRFGEALHAATAGRRP